MSDREKLIEALEQSDDVTPIWKWERIADRLLAAGWRHLPLPLDGPEFDAAVERALDAEHDAVCDDPDCCRKPDSWDAWDRKVMGAALRAALTGDAAHG